MNRITRRKFLQHTSVLTAAGILGTACSDSSDSAHSSRHAVIIGSGFAGSVAALRLGEAGIRTTLIERGQEWAFSGPETFPGFSNPDRRTTWFGERDAMTGSSAVTPYAGMIERVSGDTIDAVGGACLGGGSLVYGGVLLQPRRDIFEDVFPFISYDDMDQVYYPRVLQQFGAAPIPEDVLASAPYAAHRAFLEDASKAGFETYLPAASFDWDVIRQELRGEIPPAATISEYIYGCNSNAKLSTDKHYLKDAVATGNVSIQTLCEVEMISERDNDYVVTYRRIDALGNEIERVEVMANYVFMAAGSLNTSRILLASQQSGELSASNDRIGKGWGTNGDQLFLEARATPLPGPQAGPACISAVDRGTSGYPIVYEHSPAFISNIQIQLAMSVPDELGELNFDADGNWGIRWPDDSATASALARQASFDRLTAASGGTGLGGLNGRTTVWHPLGGAVMGDACDNLGQLFGYRNLFVIDGSLFPGSSANSNPAFTVAANAERIMHELIPQL